MRLLISLFLVCTLVSCITQERCNDRYPYSGSDSTHVRDSIVIQTHTVTIPGERVEIHDSIPCPELEYKAEVKKNHLTAKIRISKGKLSVECIADSLKRIIESQSHIIETYRKQKVAAPEKECEHVANTWDKFCYWWTGISALAIIITLLFLYLKRMF